MRKELIALALFALFAGAAFRSSPAAPRLLSGEAEEAGVPALPSCERCNIILITVDALAAKHVGSYGYGRGTTPYLDKFFGERGIILERLFANAPWTLPSHASLLTSRMPSDLKVEAVLDKLPEDALLLQEVLRAAGWRTQTFNGGLFAVAKPWGFDRGFDKVTEVLAPKAKDARLLFPKITEWLWSGPPEPFFLFAHATEVHDPWEAPAPYDRAFGDGTPSRPLDIADIVKINTKTGGWTKAEEEEFVRAYDQEILYTDSFFKDFFAALEAGGLLENTIILITSDHGEEFGEHGTIGLHAITLHDELIHVPGLLYVPGAEPGRAKSMMSHLDIAPTLLDLAGLETPKAFLGTSLREIVALPGQGGDRVVVSETINERSELLSYIEAGYELARSGKFTEALPPVPRQPDISYHRSVALRSERFKLIQTLTGDRELYGLAADPGEYRNIYNRRDRLPLNERQEVRVLEREMERAIR